MMADQTLLYRLFGLGKIPREARARLEAEGVVHQAEGIAGSMRFRHFRAPGRRYLHKSSWFSGSIVLTQNRLVAYTMIPFANPILDVPLDHPRIDRIECGLDGPTTLLLRFDPANFRNDWAGEIECRFATRDARVLADRLFQFMSRVRESRAIDVEALWSDPSHWSAWGKYRCKKDPRLIVPKQARWTGWTLNFAHPSSIVVLVAILLIALVPTLLVVAAKGGEAAVIKAVLGSGLAVAALVIVLHLWAGRKIR